MGDQDFGEVNLLLMRGSGQGWLYMRRTQPREGSGHGWTIYADVEVTEAGLKKKTKFSMNENDREIGS